MRAYPTPLPAVSWIYGCVRTYGQGVPVPGYRSIKIGSTTYTIGTGGAEPFWAWQWMLALDTAITGPQGLSLSGASWSITSPYPTYVEWVDRSGWLLGFDAEPGDQEPVAFTFAPRTASPIVVPLTSCDRPSLVTRDAQRSLKMTRFGRGLGWTYGAADVYRCAVRVDRAGFEALDSGWVTSGQPVIVSRFDLETHALGSAIAFSPSEPTGYLEGVILGSEGGLWDKGELFFETTLLIAVEVP